MIEMIERWMPIFAVIGFLSTLGYLGLMVWVMYGKFHQAKKKQLPTH